MFIAFFKTTPKLHSQNQRPVSLLVFSTKHKQVTHRYEHLARDGVQIFHANQIKEKTNNPYSPTLPIYNLDGVLFY